MVGVTDGTDDGAIVVGMMDGATVVVTVGVELGTVVGVTDGINDGARAVGIIDGATVAVGALGVLVGDELGADVDGTLTNTMPSYPPMVTVRTGPLNDPLYSTLR